MHNSDLVELLALLQPDECHRLRSYLRDTVEARPEVTFLVEYALEHLHDKENSALSRTTVYEIVFPGLPPIANKLEKLMSDTLQIVRQFVAAEMATRDLREMQQQVFLQRFYREREPEKKFRQSRSQVLKLKAQPGNWVPQDFYFQFLSEEEESMFLSARNQKKDDLNLWNTIRALDEYYLVERLRYSCVLLNQNQLVSLNLPPLNEWLPFDLSSPHLQWFFDKPLGRLFQLAVNLFSSDSSDTLDQNKKLEEFIRFLEANEDVIPLEFINSLEIFACNYGIKQFNQGHYSFLNSIFLIQKRRVESGRIYINGSIKSSEFHSIVVAGLRLKHNVWTKHFIEQHRDKIQGAMPSSDYYQFNLIYYYFQTKEYEPELHTLLTSNYEDMLYKLQSKMLEIKILYEMSRRPDADYRVSEFLENKVEAAIVFFFREKNIPPDKRKMYKRFADTMKRILHAEGKDDLKRLEKIRADIDSFDLIADRQWILGIVDALLR
ncbi:MAG TPA: hypothetical protein PKL15_11400 [Saprospiraceae bacterium]|nr:hypothetical protein [Saprospiraceae bacterium]